MCFLNRTVLRLINLNKLFNFWRPLKIVCCVVGKPLQHHNIIGFLRWYEVHFNLFTYSYSLFHEIFWSYCASHCLSTPVSQQQTAEKNISLRFKTFMIQSQVLALTRCTNLGRLISCRLNSIFHKMGISHLCVTGLLWVCHEITCVNH